MTTTVQVECKSLNILLAEDDDVDAKTVQRAFQKSKIVNTMFRGIDGVDALDILKGTNGKKKIPSPYMLLVDLNMPRMGGIELVQALRNDPELHRSIVFILTTSGRDEDKIAAYNLNVAGYIVKSKAGEDFLDLINMIDSYWRIVEMS